MPVPLTRAALVKIAIGTAEKNTSGEIRVHIQPRVGNADIRTVAERTFERLGMTKTELRNGVLLFIACEEQRFVILGDRGIDEKVPALSAPTPLFTPAAELGWGARFPAWWR